MQLTSFVKRTRRRLKFKLANKFVYFSLPRLLIFHFWFRLAFLAFLLLVLFIALYLPKIWTMSPPGFLPIVKVSGLDLTQAWSLRRTALQAQAMGQKEQALHAWRAAVVNNPANPELVRGFLRAATQSDKWVNYLGMAVGQSFWLLRLTQTNQADLVLTAQVLEKYQLYDLLLTMLDPKLAPASLTLQGSRLKALLFTGQMRGFAALWDKYAGLFSAQPDLALYHAAYVAGWGPVENRAAGRQQLEEAIAGPSHQVLANRLLASVCIQLEDPQQYEQCLRRLEDLRAVTLLDRIDYWRLLAATGYTKEAAKAAEDYAFPPVSALETLRLAQVYVELGHRDLARQVLERYASEFSYLEGMWILYSQLLIQDQQWESLDTLALQIRNEEGVRASLAGYSYYLEGRAELGLNRPAMANAAFKRTVEFNFPNHELAMSTAAQFLQLGHPDLAMALLKKLPKEMSANLTYWKLMFATAYELKDPDTLLSSATAAYNMRTNDIVFVNNYAAALLTTRTKPEDAIRFTVQMMAHEPDSVAVRVNHSLALVMNQRPREALELLHTIDAKSLSPVEANAYYLTLFEVQLKLEQWDQARQASEHIATKFLFPNQLHWLEQARQTLPPPPEPKP